MCILIIYLINKCYTGLRIISFVCITQGFHHSVTVLYWVYRFCNNFTICFRHCNGIMCNCNYIMQHGMYFNSVQPMSGFATSWCALTVCGFVDICNKATKWAHLTMFPCVGRPHGWTHFYTKRARLLLAGLHHSRGNTYREIKEVPSVQHSLCSSFNARFTLKITFYLRSWQVPSDVWGRL